MTYNLMVFVFSSKKFISSIYQEFEGSVEPAEQTESTNVSVRETTATFMAACIFCCYQLFYI